MQYIKNIHQRIAASRAIPWCIIIYVIYALLAELVFTNTTIRYRMTVRVETPEGIKEGSAVREIYMSQGIQLTPESHPVTRIKGESVVVDLGKRGQVFTILSDDATDVFIRLFNEGGLSRKGIRIYRYLKTGKRMLEPLNYPRMVTFTNLQDPMSVMSVYKVGSKEVKLETRYETQYFIEDRFEKQFGAGVKLKDITMEITADPVTYSIEEKWLPWIGEYKNKSFDELTIQTIDSKYPLANSLGKGSFTTGAKK